jgi:hypothetical protein
MYKIHLTLENSKTPLKKKAVQNLMAVPTKDFDEAWESMRKTNRILRTKRKDFVLNGTHLAARMNMENRLAS